MSRKDVDLGVDVDVDVEGKDCAKEPARRSLAILEHAGTLLRQRHAVKGYFPISVGSL